MNGRYKKNEYHRSNQLGIIRNLLTVAKGSWGNKDMITDVISIDLRLEKAKIIELMYVNTLHGIWRGAYGRGIW